MPRRIMASDAMNPLEQAPPQTSVDVAHMLGLGL